MSEQLTLTEESYSLSIVEDNDLQLTLSGERGPAGANGAVGAAGPNTLTTATTTNLTGFISGNGTNIAGATAAATAATANTLVLRDANGGASFGPLSALAGSGNQHSITSSAGTNIVGPLALSGSTGDTLTATYNAAITLNSTTGVNVNGGPITLTQTWTDAAVTYTGLQVNVTDTASNAASLLMDLRVGGVSRLSVNKTGKTTIPSGSGATTGLQIGPNVNLDTNGPSVFTLRIGGSRRFQADSTCARADSFGVGVDVTDTLITRDAAGTLAQRNGNAAQESRIYGTYTGPGNYRRLALKMSTAGVAQIVAEGGGSGAVGNRIEIDGLRIGKGGGDVAFNTALGAFTLNANTTGNSNSAVGYEALRSNTSGGNNTAVGSAALRNNTTGSNNSAVGVNAGRFISDGTNSNAITTNSVYLGGSTKALASGQTNQIVIGHDATGLGSNTAVLGNDSIVTTALKGNVGIGTTSPASKLDVVGNITASGAVTAAGNVALGTASTGSTLSFVPRSAQNITQVILSTAADEMIIGETGAGKRVIFGGGAQNNFMRSSGMSTTGLVVGSTSTAVSGVAYIAGMLGVGIAAPTTALDVVGSIKASGTVQTGGYLFANLPTSPTTGMRAYITDGAALPLYMANAAGGGSTVTPVFYNGTNWINA